MVVVSDSPPPGKSVPQQQDARDEESPLLPQEDATNVKPLTGVVTIIAVLLLGKATQVTKRDRFGEILMRNRRIHFQCGCDTGDGGRRSYRLRI
jgi:hypothetical protein